MVSEYEIARREARRKELQECARVRREQRANMTPGQILIEKLRRRQYIIHHKAAAMQNRAERLRERADRLFQKAEQIGLGESQYYAAIQMIQNAPDYDANLAARALKMR